MTDNLISVIIGGCIGIAGSIVTTIIAYPLQQRREDKIHRRDLLIAKKNRLYEAGQILLVAAKEYQEIVHQVAVGLDGSIKNIEQANQWFNPILYGRIDLDKPEVTFLVENHPDVVTAFRQLRNAVRTYHKNKEWTLNSNDRNEKQRNIDEQFKSLTELIASYIS